MSAGFDWAIVSSVGIGVGALLVGIGVFIAMRALAKTLARVNITLDEVDRQLDGIGTPVGATLAHVGGIADSADQTVARLSGVVKSLETVAGSAAQAAELTRSAVSPAIVNVGAAITGVSAGLRRFVTGRNHNQN